MNEDHIKNTLQLRLLNAVKQCQKYFGTNSEDVGTEGDLRVSALCSEWESILVHGIKRPKNKIRFNKLESSAGGVSIWHVVLPFLSDEEVQRFNRLQHINTDIGKGRAWLRAALNERTLENYLHSLLANREHLYDCYESHAFLLDEERTSLLPTMAAGLSSIIFSLSIDSEFLNTPLKPMDVPPLNSTSSSTVRQLSPSPVIIETQPPTPTHAPPTTQQAQSHFGSRISDKVLEDDGDDSVVAVRKEKKKKSKKNVKSVSPQPPPLSAPSCSSNNNSKSTNQTSVPSKNSSSPTDTPTSAAVNTSSFGNVLNAGHDPSFSNHDNLNPFGDGSSLCSTPSITSLNSVGEDGSAHILFNAPSSPFHKPYNEDTLTMDSQAAIEATSMVLAATGEHRQLTTLPSTHTTATTTIEDGQNLISGNNVGGMSPQEMKEALKVLVRSKEDLQETNERLMMELRDEKSLTTELKKEVDKMKEEMASLRETQTQQAQSLERENDLLREQLKRYVGLVQQHQNTDEQKDLAAKLSDMAEMYGELMEFNDRLHKDVYNKNSVITVLCHTLLEAGLEVPFSSDQLPRDALHPKRVVDIWVPSVIRRDKGHHVYQIYISLGNEEWNVYRRFAEFYEFHHQMMKNIDGIDEFPFPPKKAIGSKTTHVVEERRARLQEYLRFIIDVCSKTTVKRKDGRTTKSILDYKTSKEDFIRIFPFFKTDSAHSSPSSSSSSSASHPPLVKSPSYSGL